MILASDVEEKIRFEIDKFRKEKPNVCYDMKRIAVNAPFPYYQLIEKIGNEIDNVTIVPNLRECWVGDNTNTVVFEDGVGLNMGFCFIDFAEKEKTNISAKYICRHCEKEIDESNFKEHEKKCAADCSIVVRCYYIDENISDEIMFGINKVEVNQVNYPNAVIHKDKIDLISDSNVLCNLYFNEQQLDEVKELDDGRISVYTINLSEKHKNELIEKLLEAKINKINDYIFNLKSMVDKYNQALASNDYIVNQHVNTYL